MNKLLKIEPRFEGSDEMVLIVPPEMVEKLKNAQILPECLPDELRYHVVTLGVPIDTTDPDDVSMEEIEAYIKHNAERYSHRLKNGDEDDRVFYADHPVPFCDFPAPINEHIAKVEIRKERVITGDWDEFDEFDDDGYLIDGYINDCPLPELESASKTEAAIYSKSFEDAVLMDHSLIDHHDETSFEKEKAIIQQLSTRCNLPRWKIIYYLKIHDKFEVTAFCC